MVGMSFLKHKDNIFFDPTWKLYAAS